MNRATVLLTCTALLFGACSRPASRPAPAPAAKPPASRPARPVDEVADSYPNISLSNDLQPPRSTSRIKPRRAVEVTITRYAILVEDLLVAKLRSGEVDSSIKQDGQSGYLINPLLAALQKQAVRLKKVAQRSGGKMPFKGELVFIAHHATPYRLLSEVVYTAGQAEFGAFRLLTLLEGGSKKRGRLALGNIVFRAPRYMSSGQACPPGERGACVEVPKALDMGRLTKLGENATKRRTRRRGRGDRTARRRARLAAEVANKSLLKHLAKKPPVDKVKPRLNLTVAVSYKGHLVAGAGGVIGGPKGGNISVPCKRLEQGRCARFDESKGPTKGSQLTWPGRWLDEYDYVKLASMIKKAKVRFPHERQVIVTADRHVPLQVVVRTIDAVRGKATKKCTGADGCLFDTPILSAGVQ